MLLTQTRMFPLVWPRFHKSVTGIQPKLSDSCMDLNSSDLLISTPKKDGFFRY